MSFRRGNDNVPDFPSLVAAYPDDEFESPTRSTVPLLSFWANPESRFAELSTGLGLAKLGSPQFCFEFPVCVQQGAGKSSFTDLMILGPSAAVAIEGKYTEPPYETVREWLGSEPSENRLAVLAGWLELIGSAVGAKLNVAAVGSYPYQLIHRTASACHPTASHRWVVYQLFAEERVAYYRSHLTNFCRQLGGASALRFGLLVTPPELTSQYVNLKKRWASGVRGLSSEVRSGLLSDALFKFSRIEFSELDSRGSAVGVAG